MEDQAQYIEKLEELTEVQNMELTHLHQEHQDFIDQIWKLVNYDGEWEYPAQVIRYLATDLVELRDQLAAVTAQRDALKAAWERRRSNEAR